MTVSREKMEQATAANRHILIVDDSPEDRYTYQRLLSCDPGYTYLFFEADTGEEGLRILQSQRIDCILLDYRLPDLDGLEFLVRLGESDPGRMIPVIVLTARGNEWVAVQAM